MIHRKERPCQCVLWHLLLQWQDVRMLSSTASVVIDSNPGDKGRNTSKSFEAEWDVNPNITLNMQLKM